MLTIEGTFNTRVVRDAADEPWLYRSAALDTITTTGLAELARHGVGLVLDLREGSERGQVAHGLPVAHVPLYRAAGGPPVTGSLTQVYRDLVTHRGRELARAVGTIADAETPVLVHCAAGKDRTGLVVALALRAAGVSDEATLADYALSGDEVRPHRAEAVARTLASLGLSGSEHAAATQLHLASPPAALAGALALVAELGGVHRYLLDHGLHAAQLERLARRGRPS